MAFKLGQVKTVQKNIIVEIGKNTKKNPGERFQELYQLSN